VRVLVLSNLYPPDFTGGYELICSQVVDALRAHGHEVCVLTSAPRRPVPSVDHVCRELQLSDVYDAPWAARVPPIVRRLDMVQAQYINSFNVYRLLHALESLQPDVVFLYNLVGLGGLGLLACLQHLRIPWVWHLEDAVPAHLCSNPDWRGAADNPPWGYPQPVLVRELNRQLKGSFLACSLRVVKEIEAAGLHLGAQVELLPNWVHGRRPPARPSFFRGGHLRIVSAGALGTHKGTDLIIKMAARLRDQGCTNFSIDLYGKCAQDDLQVFIDRLDLRPWVTMKGVRPQTELAQLFAEYDVFAFPTWAREPFGVAPLEAAATGCVPLLSQCCGIAEWLMHGVHCLKVERTVEAFTQVIQDIVQGKIDLAPLGRRVSAVVCRDFHLESLLPRIERALARAASRPRAGAGSATQAYQLALLADRSARVLAQETLAG